MSGAKRLHDWSMTASIQAMLVNVNRGSADDPLAQPQDFLPAEFKDQIPAPSVPSKRKASVDVLIMAFGGKPKPL